MNLSIEDSLGLETGVLIQNVKASSDEDNNMKIFGQMRKREGKYVNLFLEPEIVCDLVDTAGAILYSTVSRHSGCFGPVLIRHLRLQSRKGRYWTKFFRFGYGSFLKKKEVHSL